MLVLPGCSLLVQTAQSTRASVEAHQKYAELHTYWISVESGEGIYIDDALPLIHAVVSDRVNAAL